jgi:hypothetical protein
MIDIYTALLSAGLTTSQRDFSTFWCNRAPNYMALGNGLSDSAKIAVFRNLIASHRWWLALRVAHSILFGGRSE